MDGKGNYYALRVTAPVVLLPGAKKIQNSKHEIRNQHEFSKSQFSKQKNFTNS
jgi:hypothetical protein